MSLILSQYRQNLEIITLPKSQTHEKQVKKGCDLGSKMNSELRLFPCWNIRPFYSEDAVFGQINGQSNI